MTFPSSLNMLTSSMAWMGWTFIFLSVVWSFLSSVVEVLWTRLVLRRGVPLPLFKLVFRLSAGGCDGFGNGRVWWFISGDGHTLLSEVSIGHNCTYEHIPAKSFNSNISHLQPTK